MPSSRALAHIAIVVVVIAAPPSSASILIAAAALLAIVIVVAAAPVVAPATTIVSTVVTPSAAPALLWIEQCLNPWADAIVEVARIVVGDFVLMWVTKRAPSAKPAHSQHVIVTHGISPIRNERVQPRQFALANSCCVQDFDNADLVAKPGVILRHILA